MEFSPQNTVSYKVVLSDIMTRLDDEDMKKFSRGRYMSWIQSALEGLSYETKMMIIEKDYAMPESLSIEVPNNCFNLREAYVYNGSCCNKSTATILHWKRDYRTKGLTEGYVTKVMKDTTDPFYTSYNGADNVNFYGIENGIIYLSPSCAGFSRLNLVFNGSYVGLGEEINIPIQLRRAVVDYVVVEGFASLSAKDPRLYATQYDRMYARLYDRMNGSWVSAVNWGKSLDTKSREDLLEYMSKANE